MAPTPAASKPARARDAPLRKEESKEIELDVYANPFIPQLFRDINQDPGYTTLITTAKLAVDYNSYSQSNPALHLLSPPPSLPANPPLGKDPVLTNTSYWDYFSHHYNNELGTLAKQNDNHSLFNHPLVRTGVSNPNEPGYFYSAYVPGLREDSPCVEIGDQMIVRQLLISPEGEVVGWNRVVLIGIVHGTSRAQEQMYLKFDNLVEGSMRFNVVFPVQSETVARQFHVLTLVDRALKAIEEDMESHRNGRNSCTTMHNQWLRKMVFPSILDGRMQYTLHDIRFQQGHLDANINYEQLKAVNTVCDNNYGTLPYLISGPPGTGKTKTLVASALQLLLLKKASHILICAPSEQAADTLASRLSVHLKPERLLRLNAPRRPPHEVPSKLLPFCFIQEDMFYLPPLSKLLAYNVVVTSCRDSAMLIEARLTNSDLYDMEMNVHSLVHPEDTPPRINLHWDGLMIDEAAQATEPLSLFPLYVVMPPSNYPNDAQQPQFIMAGDQNQLGPKTASLGKEISTSLFARVITAPVYANHPLSRHNLKPSQAPTVLRKEMLPIPCPPFTTLIRNYRSHGAILTVPSSLFYNDTLLDAADIDPDSLTFSSPIWHGRKWPVLFVPNTSNDEIETDGGGWYNIRETAIACSYAQHFVDRGIPQSEICVMSPFAAQVRRLRSRIRSSEYGHGKGLWKVNIGPTEAFQGLESRIVIICTTRTRSRFLEQDKMRGLGLIDQPKKMNVSLTRAKEGLIVIGGFDVLREDVYWAEWLAFCVRNGLIDASKKRIKKMRNLLSEGTIGHLERRLLAQQDANTPESKRVLGRDAGTGLEDEMWAMGLDEEGREIEHEYDCLDDVEDGGIEEEDDGYDEVENNSEENGGVKL